jgi:hypothetical protein
MMMVAFGAERAACSDRDGRRQRFEQGNARLHAATADEDGLHGFGDAVPADSLRAEARHQTNEQASGDGYKDRRPSQPIERR